MDEHCGALTPSWDRLLTEGELEDGLSCPSLTDSASAQPGLLLPEIAHILSLSFVGPRDVLSEALTNRLSSFSEAQNSCRDSNAPRPERKANRLFTFSSGSAAKISPVVKVYFSLHFPELVKICRFSANSRPLFSCISNALPLHSSG